MFRKLRRSEKNRGPRDFPGHRLEDDPDVQVTHPESSLWAEARSLTRDIFFAAIIALLIMVFVVRPVKVEGTSMLPRLENDERIFVNEFIYNFADIQRGDIVVFWYPEDPSKSFIKRVIGLPGETVRIDSGGKVFINDRLLEEPYLSPERNQSPRSNSGVFVKNHYYFVMGDNRDASNDSRAWGLVPKKYIYGKAMFRYWPFTRMGLLDD